MTAPGRLTVELDRVTLEALTWGPVDGPLAVCLHGFPDTAHTWRHLGPALADAGWRVVAPFTRGYAPSSIPTDGSYHVGALMDDAIGVHAALGGDERAVVIGHDWGAVTVNGLAAFADSPFARVVSMSVPPTPAIAAAGGRAGLSKVALFGEQALRSSYMAFFQLPFAPEQVFRRLMPALWSCWSPTYDASDDIDAVLDSLGSREHRTAALGYYRALRRPNVPARYRAAQQVWGHSPRVPMLYLHGGDDGCFSADFAEGMNRLLPEGSDVVVVPSAGHFLQLDRPDAIEHHVTAFLSR
ncbi:epoxide hydrolase [Rhodococcoides trifolii]|uniref:Epoxide hydrolase n=1 Tax=Rhodococcoides trifolii TaxID=908250 RepID=A0A917LE51_9NOCA|nr:alpha/beta fold hydrolase [Rhodococcus trifolii]GGG15534.1 epoxide hydrolase [Rhodococcus trifolii]